ncbi:threonine/homoserine/homoserine lactone efflux protein [Rhodovulum imhoffii]|uniref:Threonine/homoserine/homoserine lactone efflux protein n=1 Tax=Rhodovulum imhoffii TaxID=365340 RepID=A0A2T5BTF1_9RHOB|nr:LysE family translocator [Rhodovulum imhoffii]MBK5934346.1 lysine transporter LysE [Rhodovulum imhoffii]PTN02703.1 threonine/homoserine/homoserine lactone efflux protein [Rhodovulum imhoffii]
MSLDLWLAFLAASALLLMIPGPTVLLVTSYALSQGRRVAVAMALGVALGDLIALSASLAGLGALVLTSATLFTVLKWAGAAYLVYLGLRLWRNPPVADTGEMAPKPARAIFWHAAAVTALNPKSIGFFIAFVPQFLRPEAPLVPQFAIITASFVALAALNALTYALLADRLRARLRPAILRRISRAGGGALIGMAALSATASRT